MKHQRNITEKKIKSLLWPMTVFYLFSALFIFTQAVLAQKEPDGIAQPYKINGKEVKEYLMEKYGLRKDDVTSEIQQTPNGPSGKMHLRGEIKPKHVFITEDTVEGRARAIAKAFLAEESVALFGITKPEEIREYKIKKDLIGQPGWTGIYYQRYIDDLPLDRSLFQVFIRPDGTINSVSAYLVPPPLELYQAVKKKTLTEDEIRKIVEDDIKTNPAAEATLKKAGGSKSLKLKKLAISLSPYVVWKVESVVWHYSIDAFTGEILEKFPGWIE